MEILIKSNNFKLLESLIFSKEFESPQEDIIVKVTDIGDTYRYVTREEFGKYFYVTY